MPSYNLKRFSDPKALRSVAPDVLARFLSPYRDYLQSKGFDLPEDCSTLSDFDSLSLTAILMTPDETMPAGLVDALYFTHEMASDRAMDDLLAVADRIGLFVPETSTPLDAAMRIWVHDREALERAHSQKHITRSRSFEHYQAESVVEFCDPTDEKVVAMESALDEWFTKHKCGGNSKVFVYPAVDEVWFLVRHGDTYKRESAVEGYKSKGLFFRPEAFDVACYVPSTGELRIHAKSKAARDLYRRELGMLIAGDPRHFPGDDKYTLDPLMEEGQRALYCRDITGVDSIILSSLRVKRRGVLTRSYHVDYSAENVFFIFMEDLERLNERDTLIKAKFTVKFSDSDKPRSVTLYPPNKVQVCRDSDTALVETWLRKRGFVIGIRAEHDGTDGVLASM